MVISSGLKNMSIIEKDSSRFPGLQLTHICFSSILFLSWVLAGLLLPLLLLLDPRHLIGEDRAYIVANSPFEEPFSLYLACCEGHSAVAFQMREMREAGQRFAFF